MMINSRFNLQQCYLLLTRKCNLSCSHCIRSSDPTFSEFISLELCEKIFTELSLYAYNSQLLLSGGEPTLHPKFVEIVSKAYNKFNHIMINSNGLNFYKLSKLITFRDKVNIQISLDGDFAMHESIRGVNTYHKTLKNINDLSELGFKVVVATTVSNKNIQSISHLDKDLEKVNLSLWTIKRIVGYGRSEDNDDISSADWNDFFIQVKRYFYNSNNIAIHPMFSLESFANAKVGRYPNSEFSKRGANCGTGRSKLYINPNGSVYPCACMEENIVGNFSSDNYEAISMTLSSLNISPNKYAICHKCKLWSICQGGCPGISERNLYLGDPRCPIVAKATLLTTKVD